VRKSLKAAQAVEFITALTIDALLRGHGSMRFHCGFQLVAVPVQGTIDAAGRLVAADPPLMRLHRQAGGDEGGALAIPQMASLARLCQSLGVQVSRTVIAADGPVDLDLTILAQPKDGGVQIAIEGWHERTPAPVPQHIRTERAHYYAKAHSDGIWQCDERLSLTAIPPILAQTGQLDSAQFLGEPLLRLFRLVEDEAGDLPMVSAIARREAFAGQLVELRNNPAVRLWLSGDPRLNAESDFCGYAGHYAIVDHRQLAATPPSQQSAIETDESDIGFAEALEAALREPIARIITNADEISARSQGAVRQNYAGYANDIAAAGRHLLTLIEDIADMRAVEQDNCIETPETIDLADIARRASGLLKVRASDQGVKIDAPFIDDAVEARGDFRRTLQIMVNLLTNAIRYSPSGANIWIRTEVEGDLAAVIVADQGKGIALEDQARIFEKFERIDPSEPGGTGLGLYISRRLARAMGGDITVDSAPGQGSRFMLTLPLA
jgi:signal transduction histidine kinase